MYAPDKDGDHDDDDNKNNDAKKKREKSNSIREISNLNFIAGKFSTRFS